MNLKQFLKPDWRKIIVFVLFLFYSIYAYFSGFPAPGGCATPGFLEIYSLFAFLITGRFFFYFGTLLNVIYIYLLSCLIIWIYSNFRKIKKIYWVMIVLVFLVIPYIIFYLYSITYFNESYFAYYCGSALSSEMAKSKSCSIVMKNPNGCITVDPSSIAFDGTLSDLPPYDANGDGKINSSDTLQSLCEEYFGVTGATAAEKASNCRKVCGCTE